jgi:N-acyl-D-amino-acid deacylase
MKPLSVSPSPDVTLLQMASQPAHDLVFLSASLIDGSGSPARRAHVAVDNGLISAIVDADDSPPPLAAHHTVDCAGLVLAPGFIDAHTHDDALMLEQAPLQAAHPKLSQGVTTVVVGNCGISLAPLQWDATRELPAPLNLLTREQFRFSSVASYFEALSQQPPVCNVVTLVGHTSLRVKHMADTDKPATPAQAAAMADEVQAAMQQGAWGLSTGVFYPPARAATMEELITVAEPLGSSTGLLTMHIRDDTSQIDSALEEAFQVGRSTKASLVISHHKLSGKPNHGRSAQTLALIEEAAKYQEVCLDCYPYDASSTMLLPERVHLSREVLITWSSAEPSAAGRSLFQMAEERGLTPQAMATQLVPAGAINFSMDEADVQRIMQHPLTMIGSDGLPGDPHPHPRLWGSFPRVLGRYARNQRLFPLETAVRKMTAWPASRFGLDRATPQRAARGQVKAGWVADLVLFDPNRVQDNASYTQPTSASDGVRAVYLAGQLAAKDGLTVNAHAGAALRRSG